MNPVENLSQSIESLRTDIQDVKKTLEKEKRGRSWWTRLTEKSAEEKSQEIFGSFRSLLREIELKSKENPAETAQEVTIPLNRMIRELGQIRRIDSTFFSAYPFVYKHILIDFSSDKEVDARFHVKTELSTEMQVEIRESEGRQLLDTQLSDRFKAYASTHTELGKVFTINVYELINKNTGQRVLKSQCNVTITVKEGDWKFTVIQRFRIIPSLALKD